MAESAVAKSVDIKAAALNLNAKAAALEQRLVGVWELAPTAVEPPAAESIASHDLLNEAPSEGVIGDDDGRILVDHRHFAPGGKYRSIVKILCHHEFQKAGSWMQGTGWLIRPDLLVTAGHCTYDWGHKFGRVTEVKAYIGYHGKQNVNSPDVQFRHVKKVVAPMGWLRSKGNKARDVGFMQLDKPFTNIKPISFVDTTSMGDQVLGVVGYPGDKYDMGTHEKGAHMYEMYEHTRWNLAENNDTMLQYKIDTFGGNSGSPVLIKDTNVSVGAHVYGGSVDTFNAASVIGAYGNVYQDCINAFDTPIPKDGALHIVPASGSNSKQQNTALRTSPVRAGTRTVAQRTVSNGSYRSSAMRSYEHRGNLSPRVPSSLHSAEAEEEGFFDILRGAVKLGAPVVGNVLRSGLPLMLGPMGGPIGALAHTALGAAAKMAESIEENGGAESDDPQGACEGVVERAVLAEAALQTLQQIPLTHAEEESIFSDMKDHVMKNLPIIKKTAARVLPAMMEPALRIALDGLQKHNQGLGNAEGFDDSTQEAFRPAVPYSEIVDRPSHDRNAEQFIAGITTTIVPPGAESGDTEEGFLDFVKIGIRAGGTIFKTLSSFAEADEVGAEGFSDVRPTQISGLPGGLSADALMKRALVSEAALRAITKLPRRRLEEEGFFDSVLSTIKKVAPIVKQVAPIVLDNVHPIAGQLVRGVLGGAPQNTGLAPPARGLRKQRSTGMLQGNAGDFLQRANNALVR